MAAQCALSLSYAPKLSFPANWLERLMSFASRAASGVNWNVRRLCPPRSKNSRLISPAFTIFRVDRWTVRLATPMRIAMVVERGKTARSGSHQWASKLIKTTISVGVSFSFVCKRKSAIGIATNPDPSVTAPSHLSFTVLANGSAEFGSGNSGPFLSLIG